MVSLFENNRIVELEISRSSTKKDKLTFWRKKKHNLLLLSFSWGKSWNNAEETEIRLLGAQLTSQKHTRRIELVLSSVLSCGQTWRVCSFNSQQLQSKVPKNNFQYVFENSPTESRIFEIAFKWYISKIKFHLNRLVHKSTSHLKCLDNRRPTHYFVKCTTNFAWHALSFLNYVYDWKPFLRWI